MNLRFHIIINVINRQLELQTLRIEVSCSRFILHLLSASQNLRNHSLGVSISLYYAADNIPLVLSSPEGRGSILLTILKGLI